jgi:hypothetical protein
LDRLSPVSIVKALVFQNEGPLLGVFPDLVRQGCQKWFSDVVCASFFRCPDTTIPNTASYLTPSGGTVVEKTVASNGNVTYSTNTYDYILQSGSYVASSLPGKTLVVGQATLASPNGWNLAGNATFKIAKGGSIVSGPTQDASVTVYCGGSSLALAGNSVINQPGLAANFIVYGAPSITDFSLSGNAGFTGVLVAPQVDLKMNGGGNNQIDFVGAIMVNSVTMNGHFSFHYDEALSRLSGNGRFLITSWDEIPIN